MGALRAAQGSGAARGKSRKDCVTILSKSLHPREHPPKPPFWKSAFCEDPKSALIQKRVQGQILQIFFPSPHEAAAFLSAIVAEKCASSIRMTRHELLPQHAWSWRLLLVARYSAILRYYSCYTPYSAIPFRGQLDVRYPPPYFVYHASKCQCDRGLYGGYSAIGCYTWKTKSDRV